MIWWWIVGLLVFVFVIARIILTTGFLAFVCESTSETGPRVWYFVTGLCRRRYGVTASGVDSISTDVCKKCNVGKFLISIQPVIGKSVLHSRSSKVWAKINKMETETDDGYNVKGIKLSWEDWAFVVRWSCYNCPHCLEHTMCEGKKKR